MPARPSARSRHVPCRRWLRCIAGMVMMCALTPFPGPVARGDIQQPPKPTTRGEREQQRQEPPAFAVAQRVRAALDSRVDIILQSRGQIGKTVEFLIRAQPAHGTLAGPPRQLTRTTAAVTYLHRAADGPQADGFTFAVQAPGTAVSAAAVVSIDVADAAPDLAVTPAELDFGAVNLGDSTGAEVTLENQGGGVALGRISPPPPWDAEGPLDYRLAHGERHTFRILFRPGREGAFVETLRFPGEDGRRGVRLLGTGLGLPSVPGASPAQRPPLIAVPDTSGKSLPADAAAAKEPPAAPVPSAQPSATTSPGETPLPAVARAVGATEPDAPPVNFAMVGPVEVRAASASTIDLAWAPPTPLPRAYRVEMRYLFVPASMDESPGVVDEPPRVEWRAYTLADIRVTRQLVTARLHGLSAATIYALRVVSISGSGASSVPSPVAFAGTTAASGFWRVTPLKILCGLLLVCVVFYVRRRIEDRRALRAMEAGHLETTNADETFVS